MAYVNGAGMNQSSAPPNGSPQDNGDNRQPIQISGQLQEIRRLLIEPFDPGEIKWRVTATSMRRTKHGSQKRGQLLAYADQRAYIDRLNEVFGEWGWTRSYDVQVVQNFERRAPSDSTQTIVSAKVVVISKVTISGLGSHTSVGEEWADDVNAATRAEAQAFKRACACFGLGRYLYDLDKIWIDLDQNNRPLQNPKLPDWALPSYARSEAQSRGSLAAQAQQSLVRAQMLAKICELCGKAGRSLSLFVLKKYARGDGSGTS